MEGRNADGHSPHRHQREVDLMEVEVEGMGQQLVV